MFFIILRLSYFEVDYKKDFLPIVSLKNHVWQS